jgi:hypothetical protein
MDKTESKQKTSKGYEIPIPKRSDLERVLKTAAQPRSLRARRTKKKSPK